MISQAAATELKRPSTGAAALAALAQTPSPPSILNGGGRWAGSAAKPWAGAPLQLTSVMVWVVDVAAIAGIGAVLAHLEVSDRIERLLPFALVCYTGIARIAGAYDLDGLFYLKRCWPRVANAWLCTMLSIAALSYAVDAAAIVPLIDVAFWFAGGVIAIGLSRVLLIALVRRLKQAGAFDDRTAIVGAGVQGIALAEYIAEHQELAVSVVGFFDDIAPSADRAEALPHPFFGGIAELVAAIRAGAVDKVFVALPWSGEARLHTIVAALSTTPVEIRLAPDQAGFAYARHRVTTMAGLSVITLMEQPLTVTQQIMKAVEDRVLALAALVVLAPLMLLVAVAIKLSSPGPILFRQPREGYNCRTFDILKFRTMYIAPDGTADVVQARRHDPRVTGIGAVLRRSSIDELPQLYNVLLGHMSLVGPRPHAASTRAAGKLFTEIADTYAARHRVKPGLTGWAQVCGWRGETTTEESLIRRLEHDIYYVEHWSIWFDLYILARTAATVLVQRTAF